MRASQAAPAFTLLLAACIGEVGASRDDPAPGASPTPEAPAGKASPPTAAEKACVTAPSRAPMRRLTQVEYNNTVRDLLGTSSRPADAFQPDEPFAGFETNSTTALSLLGTERYMDAAEKLAADVDLAKLLPCAPAAGDDACAQQFVERFGKRAFRRALDPGEVADYLAAYRLKRARADFAGSIRLVLAAFLQSPSFLYRPEVGSGAYALASRLSYLLWASMPDDRLFAAAEAGTLTDRTKLETEVRRMLADPRALDGFQSFHRQWLGLSRLDTTQKDAKLYPEWTPALRASMKQEAQLFVADLFRSDAPSLRTLLTARYGFVDTALGALYGAAGAPPTGFGRVSLPVGQRSGILTQAAFLAVQALPDQPSPIHRGLFVRERLLCNTIPPPPTGVDIVPPKVDPNVSTRQRFEQHRQDPMCASCHGLMDPIGFGLQAYDSIGRYRTMDGKLPVDARGEISGVGPDVDGSFDGPLELGEKLVGSRTAQACMARQWMRFALGRLETDQETCVVEGIASRSGGAHLDLRELLVAVATSDTFRTR